MLVGPHEEGACKCRKPKPGLALQARDKCEIDLNRYFADRDSDRDEGFAGACGLRFSIFSLKNEPGGGRCDPQPDLLSVGYWGLLSRDRRKYNLLPCAAGWWESCFSISTFPRHAFDVPWFWWWNGIPAASVGAVVARHFRRPPLMRSAGRRIRQITSAWHRHLQVRLGSRPLVQVQDRHPWLELPGQVRELP